MFPPPARWVVPAASTSTAQMHTQPTMGQRLATDQDYPALSRYAAPSAELCRSV